MEEQQGKSLRELAAELVGQKPGELLNFALYPGGVTLIGKDGRKARLHWQPLVGWQVDEMIEGRKTEEGGGEKEDGGPKTGDGGPKKGDGKRKRGGKR